MLSSLTHPLLLSFAFTLTATSSLHAAWQNDTVLIQKEGNDTVVKHPGDNKTLFKNTDSQLAIEWGLKTVTHTVILAGEYVISDRIDIPRPGVTLVVGWAPGVDSPVARRSHAHGD